MPEPSHVFWSKHQIMKGVEIQLSQSDAAMELVACTVVELMVVAAATTTREKDIWRTVSMNAYAVKAPPGTATYGDHARLDPPSYAVKAQQK